ncbi:30S ribosome-binding factor RbfA [Desulfatibacillum aliphaticivorans]|uniref:Ribosome-binding factor A n=1 Tax=Desulfatibacillum aliphaticivorans TaxID=218208 RepID=RBFA_DESAL|nr:30S ribosome-binding factor RbfA [Desulfatibacillum aliphaticivorans]B8FCY7.1 RecName: Full=Ribosome-binding factor A [Desulfatibacillum aliphaticivorans]ACL06418.1 ribosome-binding factor A [Desulfatibacillum aliphaticivorans]
MKSIGRQDRVAGRIQQELSALIQKRINDPRLEWATITGVKMTKDLKIARVYYCVFGEEEKKIKVGEAFQQAHGFIKRELAKKLGLRYMPELEFFFDESFDYGRKIESILREIGPLDSPEEPEE